MRPDPRVDYAFKKLYGSEATVDLLEDLVNAVLASPPEQRLVDMQIGNPFNEKETAEDKLSVLDVKARDASGRLFNVEMQILVRPFFKERGLYYWARVYSGQLVEGTEYRLLHPTISICFLDGVLWPDIDAYHHSFVPVDRKTGQVLTDHFQMHFIELPKFVLTPEQLQTPLEVWCYFLIHAPTLERHKLPPALDIPPIHRALEVLDVMSQTDTERERYEARLKAIRDMNSRLAGERQEGRKEGREEGKLIGQIRICQLLLKQPQTPEEALEKLSLEDLTRLADEWQRKALSPAP
jgi:predicted transposase/invertase (TIGR01784 family)